MARYLSIPDRFEYLSTYTARRSECSSPPRGPYHSRRTLWKATQASKTTPAATDGINIKFSSVTESFLSPATTSEERCSDISRNVPARQSTVPAEPRTDRGQHAKPTVSQAHPWTLPRQLWCTSTNAIGWPFFESVYRRLLDKSSMPLGRGMRSGLHTAPFVFHHVTAVTPQKASFHPSCARFCTLARNVL